MWGLKERQGPAIGSVWPQPDIQIYRATVDHPWHLPSREPQVFLFRGVWRWPYSRQLRCLNPQWMTQPPRPPGLKSLMPFRSHSSLIKTPQASLVKSLKSHSQPTHFHILGIHSEAPRQIYIVQMQNLPNWGHFTVGSIVLCWSWHEPSFGFQGSRPRKIIQWSGS